MDVFWALATSRKCEEQLDQFELPVIEVWTAGLSVSADDLTQLRNFLSADELERAARFHFDLHRRRFIAARGVLRALLSRYMGRNPADLIFRYGPNGKPILDHGDLHFNVAHSEDMAVFAFTRIAPVGVDLECIRAAPELTQLADRFFSPREAKAIAGTRIEERNAAFLSYWTRKEAIVKASGAGMAGGVAGFDVSLQAQEQRVLVNRNGASEELFLYSLDLPEGYVGALACQQACQRIIRAHY